jgi:MFS transporter, BCD family, chlorophyll transporter
MNSLGWTGIARLGLVQACLGAIVVLTTSTLNRIMVVEHALPAVLPGFLVAVHYLVQITRPRMGHGSDLSGRRTPWILGGMALLACGGVVAALATVWMASARLAGITLALIAFIMIGLGVSASGTSLLAMLAKRVDEKRRGGAATLVWMMMIAGFAVTAGVCGKLLDPYSGTRLLTVSTAVSVMAMLLTLLALRGLEPDHPSETKARSCDVDSVRPPRDQNFRTALREVWAEPTARRFTIFVFVSMLAYSAQDLILEPFAGTVYGMTPGQTTQLSGLQHGGVLLGMILVAAAGVLNARFGHRRALRHVASLRGWTLGGCVASALALMGLVLAGLTGPGWPLTLNVFILGVANGAFSIGAIGSMMRLAGQGTAHREGMRMGLWGAAQALSFGLGGLFGSAASDVARMLIGSPGTAYGAVFFLEALLFLVSAALGWRISQGRGEKDGHASREFNQHARVKAFADMARQG